MEEIKFYEFRKRCTAGMLINGTYKVSDEELLQLVENIVLELEEVKKGVWKLILTEKILNEYDTIYIEKILKE